MSKDEGTTLYFVKTYQGLEDILAEELISMGCADVNTEYRGVSFKGNKALLYEVLYTSRYAIRVLEHMFEFNVRSEQELYDGITEGFKWHELFDVEQTFAIDAIIRDSFATHSKYMALKAKDAIVDQFSNIYGKRPNINTEAPDYLIHLHIYRDSCKVYLDASGKSLHLRGYKKHLGKAPLSEVLAAAMVKLSGWDKETLFLDPMCGSGTLLIEAALLSMNWPSQYFRESMGCHTWNNFDSHVWEQMKSRVNANRESSPKADIIGYDRHPIAVRKCIDNVISSRLYGDIKVSIQDFFTLTAPDRPSLMMFNPPYDERIKIRDAQTFYEKIGNTLKQNWAGHTVWILAPDGPATKKIGLRPSAKIPLMNGPIPCQFLKFEMYEGSKKSHKVES